jgi:predicted  nucleic acid-binding Zn-ribbon protein
MHIRSLQEKQEHTSLSLNEEKRVVAEIKELEQSKPIVALFHERKIQLDKYQEELRALKARLTEVSSKSDEATVKINEIKSQLQESIDKHKSEIPILNEQRRDLENKINEYKEKKTQLIRDFNVADRAYNDQQRLIKHIKFVTDMKKKLIEQEERRKFAQEREKEEQESKPHPYGTEIAQCDSFIAYLSSLLPKETTTTAVVPQTLEVEEGTVLLSKKEKEAQVSEQWYKGEGPKQKKDRRKRGAAAAPTLQISVDMLQFLASQGLKVPAGVEDLPATIDAIKEIRGKWEKAESKTVEKKESKKEESKFAELPDEMDFPEPQSSEVVVTHGLFKAEEAEERKDRPFTAPGSKAVREGRGRGSRGPRGARRGRAPRGDRPGRELAPTSEEPQEAAE